MKIDNSIKKTTATAVKSKQKGSASGTEKAGAGAASSVSVNVSPQMNALASMVSAANVFDANKVEEIKAAIAEGQFQVDAEKVADSLIDSTRELIQKSKVKP